MPDDAGPDRPLLQGLREPQQLLEAPVLQNRIAAFLQLFPQLRHFLPEFAVFPGDVHQPDIPRPQGEDTPPEKIDRLVDGSEQGRPDLSDPMIREKAGRADEKLDCRRQESNHEEETPPLSEKLHHHQPIFPAWHPLRAGLSKGDLAE